MKDIPVVHNSQLYTAWWIYILATSNESFLLVRKVATIVVQPFDNEWDEAVPYYDLTSDYF